MRGRGLAASLPRDGSRLQAPSLGQRGLGEGLGGTCRVPRGGFQLGFLFSEASWAGGSWWAVVAPGCPGPRAGFGVSREQLGGGSGLGNPLGAGWGGSASLPALMPSENPLPQYPLPPGRRGRRGRRRPSFLPPLLFSLHFSFLMAERCRRGPCFSPRSKAPRTTRGAQNPARGTRQQLAGPHEADTGHRGCGLSQPQMPALPPPPSLVSYFVLGGIQQ